MDKLWYVWGKKHVFGCFCSKVSTCINSNHMVYSLHTGAKTLLQSHFHYQVPNFVPIHYECKNFGKKIIWVCLIIIKKVKISWLSWLVKFIYSEKATKFCEIFPLLSYFTYSKEKISQNFVTFSEYILRIFRLFMKGKFDAYVLWPLAKRVQNWIVDRSTARGFTVFKLKYNFI